MSFLAVQSIHFRHFRNADPPALVAVWQSRAGQPGLSPAFGIEVFEQFVLAKTFFDPEGLILACDGDRVLGFAHAAFGANDTEDGISTELGTTVLLVVRPDCDEAQVAAGLLEHSEAYLQRRGAKVLYGGGIRPLNGFYLGLYGGSELPGVLESDSVAQQAFASHGYREIDRTLLFRRTLNTFEAVVDRRQMQVRRQMLVEVLLDPPPRTWWEACTLGQFDLVRFALVPRTGGTAVASATFRRMELVPTTIAAVVAGADRGLGRRVGPTPRTGDLPAERGLPPVHPRGHPRGRGPGHAAQPGRPGPVSQDGFPAVRAGKRVTQGVGIVNMSLLYVVILAVVQGLAELLPVSSSAHVIVVAKLLGLDPSKPEMTLLLVMLHTGTMFAVILYFWRAWKKSMFASRAVFKQQAVRLLIATMLTAAVGLPLNLGIEKGRREVRLPGQRCQWASAEGRNRVALRKPRAGRRRTVWRQGY